MADVQQDPRPLARIGGGDLPTIAVDPKNENVVYSASTVFWRTEDGGVTWSAVRGAPGGDDYQKTWINPNNPNILLVVSDQGGVVSANRGASWSNWYTQPTAAMYHVIDRQRVPVSRLQRPAGFRLGVRRQPIDATARSRSTTGIRSTSRSTAIAAPDPKNPDMVYGSQRDGVSLYNRKTGQTTAGRARAPSAARRRRDSTATCARCRSSGRRSIRDVLFYASNAVWKIDRPRRTAGRASAPISRGRRGTSPASAGKYASAVTPAPLGSITALSPSPRDIKVIWAGTDDGNDSGDDGRRREVDERHAAGDQAVDAHLQHRGGPLRRADRVRRREHAAHRRHRIRISGARTTAARRGRRSTTASRRGAAANSIREDPRKKGLLYAATDTQVWVSFDDGDHWQSLRLNMPAISVRDLAAQGRQHLPLRRPRRRARTAAASGSSTTSRRCGRTPRRARRATRAAYLFKPATAVRVRFGTNDPTPWPPELPAGENPPPGAHHRLLPRRRRVGAGDARDPRRARARSFARYSSADPVLQSAIRRSIRWRTTRSASRRRRRRTAGCRSTGRRRRSCSRRAPACIASRGICSMDPIGAGGGGGGGGGGAEARCRIARIPAVERAVGAAGRVHRAAHGRRKTVHAADHACGSIRA